MSESNGSTNGKATKTKTNNSAAHRAAWDSARAEILASVDVEGEYRSWGAAISGEPNEDGWVKCSAIGREDSNPSAGINVGDGPQRGRYRDFGSSGDDGSLSFFYAAARFGSGFADHKEALKHYAVKTGVKLPATEDPSDWSKQLDWIGWPAGCALLYTTQKKPITTDSLLRMGARRARWPKKSAEPQTVFALPVFGPQLSSADPTGWVIISTSGRKLAVYQGEGKTPNYEKTHTLRGSKGGLMNRAALDAIAAGTAEVIWKVEGVTDCLAVESIIPAELRGRHVVVTNSAGAGEKPRPDFARLFAGKTVHVLHDADKPGDTGAVIWAAALAEAGATVRHVRLPYEVKENHGLDVRDWLTEPPAGGGASTRTYQDLLGLAELANVIESKKASDTSSSEGDESELAERQLCNLLELDVLGEHENGAARVYSRYWKKVAVIRDVGQLRIPKLIQICGPPARDYVSAKPSDNQFDVGQVSDAIGLLAGKRLIEDGSMLGQGVWPIDDHAIVVVNGGQASVWNGSKKLEPNDSPMCRGKILDLSNTEPWVDLSSLQKYLDAARDPGFANRTIAEAGSIFARWAWRHDDDPALAVGLVMATFMQTFFPWRPQVAILGESGAGKTTLFEFLGHVFGKLIIQCEKPSEAGLRQAIGNTSKAIFIDEFEADRHRQAVLELIRTSSRGESSAIVRGTQDQKGKRFALRHICWVAAIEIGLKRDPDRNRFIQLELVKPPVDLQGKLRTPPIAECRELGIKLLAVAIENVWKAVELAKAIRDRYGSVPDRIVESYSVPAAMLMASSGIGVDRAKEWMRGVMEARDFGEVGMTDQEELVHAILEADVNLGHGNKATVGRILAGQASNHEGVVVALEEHGITRVSSIQGHKGRRDQMEWLTLGNVFLSHRTITAKLLRGTRWQDQSIDQLLKRLPGAFGSNRRISGKATRGIELPIATLKLEAEEA